MGSHQRPSSASLLPRCPRHCPHSSYARLIWHAGLDPTTLLVEAVCASSDDPDAIHPEELAPCLSWVDTLDGRQHAVLSDGWHHIRFDVVAGSLSPGPVILHYQLAGTHTARAQLLPLRRLLEFFLHRRFLPSLFPSDPRVARWLVALQIHDGLAAGASMREIAEVLHGPARVRMEWSGASDSMRSRVRRLAAEARRLARGGYRMLIVRRSVR